MQLKLCQDNPNKLEALRKENGDLKGHLQNVKEEYERLKNDTSQASLDAFKRRCNELEHIVTEREARIDLLQMKLDEIMSKAEGADVEDFKFIIGDQQSRIAILQERVARLESYNEELLAYGATDREVAAQLEEQREEIERLGKTVGDLETYIVQMEGEMGVVDFGSKLIDVEKERDHLINEVNQLRKQNGTSAQDTLDKRVIEKLNGELVLISEQKEEAVKQAKHATDLLDLAETEMRKLQEQISLQQDVETQRKALAVKLNTFKEERRVLEQQIVDLQKDLDDARTHRQVPVIVPDKTDTEKLERRLELVEHEKGLLEKEVAELRLNLGQIKEETGLKRKREQLDKAAQLLRELQERHSSWKILQPIKTVASFMRLYKPADVAVEELLLEYEDIMKGTSSVMMLGKDGVTPSNGGANPFLDEKVRCGVCRQMGHTAAECGSISADHGASSMEGLLLLDADQPNSA